MVMKFSEALEVFLDARDKWRQVLGSRFYERDARRVMDIAAANLDAVVSDLVRPPTKRKGN